MKGHWRLLLAATCVVTGWGAVFSATQHSGLVSGVYWSLTTATTVGYGDVTPHGAGGRLLAMAVMLTAIPMLAAAFSAFHLHKVRTHAQAIRRELQEVREIHAEQQRLVAEVHTLLTELHAALAVPSTRPGTGEAPGAADSATQVETATSSQTMTS